MEGYYTTEKKMLVASLIVIVLLMVYMGVLSVKVFMPHKYMNLCFQRVNEQLAVAVAVPAELCTDKDKIVQIEIIREPKESKK